MKKGFKSIQRKNLLQIVQEISLWELYDAHLKKICANPSQPKETLSQIHHIFRCTIFCLLHTEREFTIFGITLLGRHFHCIIYEATPYNDRFPTGCVGCINESLRGHSQQPW